VLVERAQRRGRRVEIASVDLFSLLDAARHVARRGEPVEKLPLGPLERDRVGLENAALLEHPLEEVARVRERLLR
jgi:hypothetical protein